MNRLISSVRGNLLPVLIAAAAGALLTAFGLGSRSIWLDEGSTFAIASQHGGALWSGIRGDGGNMLAYYLLMHVVIAWFGDATWLLRLPSVIATAATGGLVAALALRLFPGNRRLATAAGLLTVVSLPLVYWGQNARGYSWLVALTVASALAFVAIVQTPPGRAPAIGLLAAYVLSTLAALYVGFDAALVIPAQLALLPLYRERARVVTGCLALTAVLSLPLLVLAAERGSGQLFWVNPLSWRISGQAALTLLSAALVPDFHRTATTVATVVVTATAVVAGLALALRIVLDTPAPARWRPENWPLLFMLSWVLVPGLVTLLAYGVGEPIELPRVTILEMPALALLLAWLLLRAGVNAALGMACVAVLLALRLLQIVPNYGVSPEPWRAATAYVLRSTHADRPACIAFYAQDGREAFDYYLHVLRPGRRDPAPGLRPVLPSAPWGTIRVYVEDYGTLDAGQRARIARECPRLWLIGSHAGQSRGTHQSLVNLRRYYRLEYDLRRLYPADHTSLRSFGWSGPIHVRLLWR